MTPSVHCPDDGCIDVAVGVANSIAAARQDSQNAYGHTRQMSLAGELECCTCAMIILFECRDSLAAQNAATRMPILTFNCYRQADEHTVWCGHRHDALAHSS